MDKFNHINGKHKITFELSLSSAVKVEIFREFWCQGSI